MGIDFEMVAYLGEPLTDEALRSLIRDRLPSIRLYRHGASRIPGEALHCVALYDAGPTPADELLEDPQTQAELAAIRLRAAEEDWSLAKVVQASWKITRAAEERRERTAHRRPAPQERGGESSTLQLARELSRVTGSALWLCRGDHSLVGGFARFERGEVVDQAGNGDPYVSGDDYEDLPEAKWRAATQSLLGLGEAFNDAIDDEAVCLSSVDDPEARIAFDPDHHHLA